MTGVPRSGWWAVLVATALVAAGTVAALVAGGLTDGGGPGVLRSLPFLVVALLFWRWVLRDVWERARPRTDPTTGGAVPTSEQVGPWGVVGRVMIASIVVAGSLLVWAGATWERDAAGAVRAAEQAEVRARRLGLTYDEVAALVDAHRTAEDATGSRAAAAELDDRLAVPDARVVDVAVGGAGVAIFLLPSGGEPCGVLVIDTDDLRSTRTAQAC